MQLIQKQVQGPTTSTWLGTSALTPVGPTPDSVDNTIFARFLGENTKSNEIDVYARLLG